MNWKNGGWIHNLHLATVKGVLLRLIFMDNRYGATVAYLQNIVKNKKQNINFIMETVFHRIGIELFGVQVLKDNVCTTFRTNHPNHQFYSTLYIQIILNYRFTIKSNVRSYKRTHQQKMLKYTRQRFVQKNGSIG